jgi:hypothetical protein
VELHVYLAEQLSVVQQEGGGGGGGGVLFWLTAVASQLDGDWDKLVELNEAPEAMTDCPMVQELHSPRKFKWPSSCAVIPVRKLPF